jgi:RNA polymerase sigma factor
VNLNETVKELQINNNERSQFIESHIPFIIGKVTKVTNRYISKESDDEFIIGLNAFDEAINRFDPDKGNFLPYADKVIRSRVTDFLRKEHKHHENLESINEYDVADGNDLEYDVILKDEVFRLKKELSYFGITFDDLVEKAPKKGKTLKKVTGIGRKAADEDSIVAKLFKTRKLPMTDISKLVKTTMRVLKTHRDFIISVMVIITKKFNIVGDFLLETEER